MKIIDLLNKIANGEEVPNRIAYGSYELRFYRNTYRDTDGDSITDHILSDLSNLNDEVEIIEEDKKIEKINDILLVDDLEPPYDCNLEKIWIQTIKNHNKINELIDKLNSLEKKQ